MQWGILALTISLIAVLYCLVLFYLLTRTFYRALLDKPAPPVRLQIAIEHLERHLDKKCI